ncbi:Orotidine 5'-phosphate decarboxylase [Planctomycetales bacterium 10988]|nr:Orotidine 5'-phosphate decarboxylase [Planctomycetales bacterium 10988]
MSQTSANQSFIARLIAKIRETKSAVCVGLDPRMEQLPEEILAKNRPASTAEIAAAYEHFCRLVIDVVAPLVPIVKPQAAFFEAQGPAGMLALGRVCHYAADAGLLVILDGKRNDIGSTASAYAQAYLGPGTASAWGTDALTVSPYLGEDSLSPFLGVAEAKQAGIFILVKTSNPGGGQYQDLLTPEVPLYQQVAKQVEGYAAASKGDQPYGCAGAVVGATYPEQLAELRKLMPSTWFLIPGYGSQGGTSADVAHAFDSQGLGAIVNSSRGIHFAYQKEPYASEFGEAKWQEAVEAAVKAMTKDLQENTPLGKLLTAG